jgi:hypothetical protein
MFDFVRSAGFTGTQRGMSVRQKRRFVKHIVAMNPTEFHHGDCIGADEDAHYLVQKHLPECRIIIHPPIHESKRAFCKGAAIIHPAKDYLVRNRDIVHASTRMFVTPGEMVEELRSGTWSTYRYAKKLHKPIKLILPRKKS